MSLNNKSISNPPGGPLIWIVIYLELATFGMAIFGLVFYGNQEKELYASSAATMNRTFATINTILLLTSGYFIARSVLAFKKKEVYKTLTFLNYAMILGFGFILLKGFEFYEKIDANLLLDTNSFFMSYWLLTGFHWIHVLVGLVILLLMRLSIKREGAGYNLFDFEAGAAFWHMCDIIWLLLFPVLYLYF